MKYRWNNEKAAVVMEAEQGNDEFNLGLLYGKIPALKKDCLHGGEGTGEKISLTIPIQYALNKILEK